MTDTVRLRRRHLFWAVTVAVVAGLVSSAIVQLVLPYRHGAGTMYSYVYRGNSLWAFQDYFGAISSDEPVQPRRAIWFGLGAAVTLGLSLMRSKHWWWPLYPLGYALSASWTLIVFWFPILVAWIIKTGILRYAGMRFYSVARPFFLGLILGEFSSAVVWATYGMITRNPAPFFPWP